MPINSPSSNEHQIVSEFDSAKQTSREDRLEYMVSRVSDAEARRRAEDALERAKTRIQNLNQRLGLAETAYVNRHLKPEHIYEPTPDGDAPAFGDKEKELRQRFHERPKTDQLKVRLESGIDRAFQSVERFVRERPSVSEEHGLSQEHFKARRTPQNTHRSFNRAVKP